MADKRLIDANAVVTVQVFDEMYEEYSMEKITVAKAMDRWTDEGCPPTIDAVEVVRCRECVCSSMCDDQLICSRIADVMDGYYRGTAEVVKPDDYCSHGIRQTAKPLDGGAEG